MYQRIIVSMCQRIYVSTYQRINVTKQWVEGERGDSDLPEVSVEVSPDPIPLTPEETGDDRVLQEVSMLFGLTHVP